MEISGTLNTIWQSLAEHLPGILGAIAILVGGWIVAIVGRALVRKSLGYIELNRRVKSATGSEMNIEHGIAVGVFYIILVFALIGFFNALDLPMVSGPLEALVSKVLGFAPNLIGAGVLLLIAFILATVLRRLATKVLASTELDSRLSDAAGMRPISASLANVLYWLVFLLFLPAVLGYLRMQGLLEPVQQMVDEMLGLVPNIFAALAIGFVGWFVARLLRDLVTNLLSVTGVDSLGERANLKGTMSLSKLIGLVVYVFVFVTALIQAFDTLGIQAISGPATEMLRTFMAAIPNVFAAGLILVVAYLVASFVAGLVTNLLGGVGFDDLPRKLGLQVKLGEGTTPSRLVGRLIVFFAVLFAVVEAANRLGFLQVSELVAQFIEVGAKVVLGSVIIVLGLWVANLAAGAIRAISTPNAPFFAGLARFAIIGFVFAMGLGAMGINDFIVNLAFGLTLGSVALAVALSFGLGGREAAGRQMEHWMGRLRGE